MRRYLIDIGRREAGHESLPLEEFRELLRTESVKINLAMTVDRLLDDLAQAHPDWCRLVEVKYFLGLTDEEAADALGMNLRTMQRRWSDARQWLFERVEAVRAREAAAQ